MNTVKKKKVQKHAQLTTSLLQHVSLLFFDIYFSNTHLLKKRKKSCDSLFIICEERFLRVRFGSKFLFKLGKPGE